MVKRGAKLTLLIHILCFIQPWKSPCYLAWYQWISSTRPLSIDTNAFWLQHIQLKWFHWAKKTRYRRKHPEISSGSRFHVPSQTLYFTRQNVKSSRVYLCAPSTDAVVCSSLLLTGLSTCWLTAQPSNGEKILREVCSFYTFSSVTYVAVPWSYTDPCTQLSQCCFVMPGNFSCCSAKIIVWCWSCIVSKDGIFDHAQSCRPQTARSTLRPWSMMDVTGFDYHKNTVQ